MQKVSKHDRYVLDLCEMIKSDYDVLSTNVKISGKKRQLCEIDVLARKGSFFDAFEVKCSYRITKARKQAKMVRKHAPLKIDRTFFYCGASGALVLL
ncbi:MAG: hypothetical protein HGA85_00960 [Nanoarchaeota archaeon]|nr:hypothetical protein [Nanoarchaeota archaeon]